MPYIAKEERPGLYPRNTRHALKAGELTYQLTQLCTQYVRTFGKSYSILNDVIGSLECAKLEFYRRIVQPYEDKRWLEEGDVYNDNYTNIEPDEDRDF